MEKWFNKTATEVEEYLQTNMKNGLSSAEAKKRQEENGFNELRQAKKKSLFVKFLEQFKDFMIIVLIIAIGGFFLTKQSFPESDIVNIPKVKTEKKKDIKLDKDKEYIYFENNDRVVDDLDIEYKDIILNFKEKNGIQDKLNNETAELKKTAVFDEEMEDEL